MPNWVQYWCRKVWIFLYPNQIKLLDSLLSKLCTILQKPWRSLVGSSWMLHPTSQTTEKDATCQARTWPNCIHTQEKRFFINTTDTQKYTDLLLGYRPKAIWLERVWRLESGLLLFCLSLPRGERLLYSESLSSSLAFLPCLLSAMINQELVLLWQTAICNYCTEHEGPRPAMAPRDLSRH